MVSESKAVGFPSVVTDSNSFAARLARSCDQSERWMKPWRDKRKQFVDAYVGPYYIGTSETRRLPVNVFYLFVSSMLPRLAIDPRANVRRRQTDFGWFARLFAERTNMALRQTDAGWAFRQAALASLFGPGILCVGEAAESAKGDTDEPDGYLHDPGKPFIDPVSMADFIPDHKATSWPGMLFRGHGELVVEQWAMDSALYDRGELERLAGQENAAREARRRWRFNQNRVDDEDLYDQIRLRHIWLAREGVVVTIPDTEIQTQKFLREAECKLERGPYENISLGDVPDEWMALCPAAAGMDLQEEINLLARKLARQAERLKDITIVDPANPELAGTIIGAQDGDVVYGDPKGANRMTTGGIVPAQQQAVTMFRDIFNQQMGNPAAVGGLETQADTLGQEQLLLSNAGSRLSDWRNRILEAAKHVIQKVGQLVWTDELTKMQVELKGENGLTGYMAWEPTGKIGEFADYLLDVEAYSITTDTPNQQLDRMIRLVSDVYVALAPIAQRQGVELDVQQLVKTIATKADLPEFEDLFSKRSPELMMAAAQSPMTVNTGGQKTINVSGQPGRGARPAPMTAQPPATGM